MKQRLKLTELSWMMRTLVLAALLCACRPAPAPDGQASSAPAVVPQIEITRLVGKWQRPDGGYVLDIRAATENGQLDAGYFNPNPIHVSQSTWRRSETLGLVVLIELRDVNYPGATYKLYYRQADDKLVGAYTQPALGQTFDVAFDRSG